MIEALSNIEYRECESLAKHCTFRVGGPAKILILPKDKDEITEAIDYCKSNNLKYMIIGNGSNLLFADEGYDGAIIKLGANISSIEVDGEYIYAQAGAMLSVVAKRASENELTGMEFAAGIPGTLGGAVFMNAGAYGGEMKDIVESVDVLEDGNIKTYSNEEMQFSYRYSVLEEDSNKIVIGARIKLAKGDKSEILSKMKELSEARISKQPLEYPSAGSTFKRPEGYFAGKLIQDCGLKGYTVGGAQVSTKHSGFVINYNHATANEIKMLIADVQKKVFEEFGVCLETEVKIV